MAVNPIGNAPKKKKSALAIAVRVVGPAVPLGLALLSTAIPPKPARSSGQAVSETRKPTGATSAPPSVAQCSKGVPCPLVAAGHPVAWWFVFKLNAKSFPQCGGGTRTCPFGGEVQTTAEYKDFGQQYVQASSEQPTLQDGVTDCLGTTTRDPVGASFDEVYNGKYHFVVWNDQPYGDPKIAACTNNGNCAGTWGHSKGLLAWNDDGNGFVMQVSTPSWPEAGNKGVPRKTDGNTLGCIKDNDITFSQHFFALMLNKSDLVLVLQGLANASVVTDPKNRQVVQNGGPQDVQSLVNSLGKKSKSEELVEGKLSTGVLFISKPSNLNVPPWQMISAQLGGVGLRTATFWGSPRIPTTTDNAVPDCWNEALGKPGPVAIATTGSWKKVSFDLTGTPGGNHAKIGVTTTGSTAYSVFGDENQQGALSGDNCASSQNGRGGTFYALQGAALNGSIAGLIQGATGATTTSKDDTTKDDSQ
ncbi:MAG TPA: deoxyribonuclease II family protein [Acidobacteriaceae bacterium]|jgi:hypothetical protein